MGGFLLHQLLPAFGASMSPKLAFTTELERLAALEDQLEAFARPSRSRRKRDNESLRQLGADLVELSAGRLAKLELPVELRRAVDEARRLEVHGARKRQIQYIGRVMEDCDEEAIRAALAAIDQTPAAASQVNEKVAARAATASELLLGDDQTVFAVASAYAPGELQVLRLSVRKAKKELQTKGDATVARALIERCLAKMTLLS
jgi:ribosome-associated protein